MNVIGEIVRRQNAILENLENRKFKNKKFYLAGALFELQDLEDTLRKNKITEVSKMKTIRHDLNEAAQMLTGASWWLGQKNTTQARECIDRGRELLEKADCELVTEEMLEEVELMEEMQSDPEPTGLLKISSLLNKCDELKKEAGLEDEKDL